MPSFRGSGVLGVYAVRPGDFADRVEVSRVYGLSSRYLYLARDQVELVAASVQGAYEDEIGGDADARVGEGVDPSPRSCMVFCFNGARWQDNSLGGRRGGWGVRVRVRGSLAEDEEQGDLLSEPLGCTASMATGAC